MKYSRGDSEHSRRPPREPTQKILGLNLNDFSIFMVWLLSTAVYKRGVGDHVAFYSTPKVTVETFYPTRHAQ